MLPTKVYIYIYLPKELLDGGKRKPKKVLIYQFTYIHNNEVYISYPSHISSIYAPLGVSQNHDTSQCQTLIHSVNQQ